MFLKDFTGQSVSLDSFDDLPFSYMMAFLDAACSDGCDDLDPKLSMDLAESNLPLLERFCSSLNNLSLSQVQYKFQYEVELSKFEHPSQEDIQTKLETATERILLGELGCESGLRSDLKRKKTESGEFTMNDKAVSILENSEVDASCDFRVSARVSKTIDIGELKIVVGSSFVSCCLWCRFSS